MRYGIALGSNLGDRLGCLRKAVEEIVMRINRALLVAAAPVYETAPVDCAPGTPSFYNSVIEIEADAEPLEVLHSLQCIEADLGRPNAHLHHAPRTVDLDILYADDFVMNHADLTLPHPRMTQRRFVLRPLADIRPDLVLPLQTRSVAQLLKQLPVDVSEMTLVANDWA
jgi:2-amino-4-hydroxy-6-hydroxymethyldihydropteridine diphosphokinase